MPAITLFIVLLIGLNIYWSVSWRFGWVCFLTIWAGLFFLPRVHWSDQNFGYALGVGLLGLSVGFVMAVLVLRMIIALRQGEFRIGQTNLFDWIMAALTGTVAAGALFVRLAWTFEGTDQAVILHVTLLAVAGGIVMRGGVGLWACLRYGFCATIIGLTVMSGLWYPARVHNRTQAHSAGAAYTIVSRGASFQSRADFTFLTMPKSQGFPHTVLSFAADVSPCQLAWSYHRSDFRPDNRMIDSHTCPR